MDKNIKFIKLADGGLTYYPSEIDLMSDDNKMFQENGGIYFVSSKSGFVKRNSSISYEDVGLPKEELERIQKVLVKYDQENYEEYEKGDLVLASTGIFMKLTDNPVDVSEDLLYTETDFWELYVDLEENSNAHPQALHLYDPSFDYYEFLAVRLKSNDNDKLNLQILYPSVTVLDGSRLKFILKDGSVLNDRSAFLDDNHVGLSKIEYKNSRRTNGGIELHFAVDEDVITEDIGYITIGIDLENFDIDKAVFKTNNGHTFALSIEDEVLNLTSRTILEEGKYYRLDESTPFGNDDVTSYYNADMNYGEDINPNYNYLADGNITIWKAAPGSSGNSGW